MTIERDTSVTSARTKRGAASRARLRAAAQTSFAAYGYTGTRISDIVVALVWVGLVGFALDRFVGLIGRIVARGASAG